MSWGGLCVWHVRCARCTALCPFSPLFLLTWNASAVILPSRKGREARRSFAGSCPHCCVAARAALAAPLRPGRAQMLLLAVGDL